MPAFSPLIHLIFAIIYICHDEVRGNPLPDVPISPCPDIFQYELVPGGGWQAKVTLRSGSDLKGLWVRVSTEPQLTDVTVSDDFLPKYSDEETRFANREAILKAKVPKTITISGKLQNNKIPELISVTLNAKLICSSSKLSGNAVYGTDYNNKDFLPAIIAKNNDVPKVNPKEIRCGKALLMNSLTPNDNVKVLRGDWPWQAAIFKKEKDDSSSFLCEATLISDSAILTSAHCVTWNNSKVPLPPSILTVKLKNLNVIDDNLLDCYEVQQILINRGFDQENLENDIAIVKLSKLVEIDEATQPICLPESATLPEESYVLGYGFKNDASLSNLAVAKVVPLSEQKCFEMEPAYRTLINDDNYCANYVQAHETCVGGSGSAVMDVKSDSEFVWELRGILSIGRGLQKDFKCDQNSPILVVEATNYLKWIRANAF